MECYLLDIFYKNKEKLSMCRETIDFELWKWMKCPLSKSGHHQPSLFTFLPLLVSSLPPFLIFLLISFLIFSYNSFCFWSSFSAWSYNSFCFWSFLLDPTVLSVSDLFSLIWLIFLFLIFFLLDPTTTTTKHFYLFAWSYKTFYFWCSFSVWIHPCPKSLSVITFRVFAMTVSQS